MLRGLINNKIFTTALLMLSLSISNAWGLSLTDKTLPYMAPDVSFQAKCGYSIYDESALSRLCFIRAGIVAGVGLSDLAGLCEALDEQKEERILQKLEAIEAVLNKKYKMLGSFMSQLDGIKRSTDGG